MRKSFRATVAGVMTAAAAAWGFTSPARPSPQNHIIAASVKVVCEGPVGEVSHGSGVIIGEGRILTANHVSDNCRAEDGLHLFVENPHTELYVIRGDADVDLAILRFEGKFGEVAEIAPENPEVGSDLWMFGWPAYFDGGIMTRGIVSGRYAMWFLTDALCTYGNSGGGLFDKEGRLVGIASILSNPGPQFEPYRIGGFVPAGTIQKFLGA